MIRNLLFSFFLLAGFSALAQQQYWTGTTELAVGKNLFENKPRPNNFGLFTLNASAMENDLAAAPSEKASSAAASSFIISVPVGEGKTERFRVVDAPVMHPDLAARYPGIRSYAGAGVDDPSSTIRFSFSQLGFSGMILSHRRPTIYIDPADLNTQVYKVVSRNEIINYRDAFRCLTDAVPNNNIQPSLGNGVFRNADDGRLRTYRLALCASGEYSQFWLNGTEPDDAARKAKVLAALNNAMTRTNGIYERDFGVRMVLVPNNDAVIYLNASTDPFTTSGSWNSQSQTTCDNVIGSANYDVGHAITYSAPPGNGNAGCIGCVCTAGSKGSGWTAYYDFASDFFVVDYLTHEMGHQFGGNHTFTFSNEGTIAQVEPGSGSTIMGYAGITGATTDVQPHSDDYFHAISIQQITNYVETGGGAGCAQTTITGNNTPTANAGADFTIPRSTPFTLTGAGTDADVADVLTYCWEQNNVRATGFATVPSATATAGPQFRSYLPSADNTRTFPRLASILDGTNQNKWEVLPSVARTLNFRFTVRDNRAGGGQNFSDDMVLTVSGTTGPFAVSAPNTAVTWGEGTAQTVTWSVNGTNGAPVNCANVKISLSTDGGNTFPTVLAASTPNDGSETVNLPLGQSATCRIKVEAVGNIFFDISNVNFAIGAAPLCGNATGLTSSSITTSSATVSWTAVAGANNYDVDYKAASSGTWINAATATTATSVNLAGLTASTLYDWRVRANCTAGAGNYVQAQFTTAAPPSTCPGVYDVSTNGTTGGAATIPFNTDIKGTVSASGDNDYYRFVITTGGTITLTLTTLPANYHLRLLNSAGSTLQTSSNSGTTNETINRTVTAGTYFVRVYPSNNNQFNATNCYTLRVQLGTASRGATEYVDAGNENRLNVYPNPVNDVLHLSFNGSPVRTTVKITDAYGRQVLTQVINDSYNTIPVKQLGKGLYFIRVENAEGVLLSNNKFVKQ
ncbi:MAG: zinc-dependent metalloprotease [Dinghuibacter sp.]|nr:zinc-dependent metalloprotease [Dinghuibacter sp.]